MKDYIIISEIHNLKLTGAGSFRIKTEKNEFYLYSEDIISTLKNFNNEIRRVRNIDNLTTFTHRSRIGEIQKEQGAITYIACNMSIDLSLDLLQLKSKIEDQLNILLKLLSFFLREVFFINRVYVFQKNYCFMRMIDINRGKINVSITPQLFQFIRRGLVEDVFPWLFTRMCLKQEFLPFIDEYLVGRLRSHNLPIKLMIYWNALEHLTNVFWSEKGKTKLLTRQKLDEMNENIKKLRESLDPADIIFPNIKTTDIIRNNYLIINNNPPIKEKIYGMLKKIGFKTKENEKNLISQIYFIRNRLFHREFHLKNILESFKDKYNRPNFRFEDFEDLSEKFEMLLEKLFLKLLKFIPNYFHYKISKKWKNFHFLEWKEIKLPSIKEKNEIRKAKISERFSLTHDDVKQHHLYWLLEEKKDLLKYKKYINVLRFIERLKSNIKRLIYDQPFTAYINTVTGFEEFKVQFIKDFKGKSSIKYPDDRIIFLDGIIIRDSAFFSRIIINNVNFRLISNMAQIFQQPAEIPTLELVHGIFFASYIDIIRM